MQRCRSEFKATDDSVVETAIGPEMFLASTASGTIRRNCSSVAPLAGYVRIALPWQPECPQAHITSVWPLRPSQCVLQNFESFAAAQLQAGFAHFFVSDMDVSLLIHRIRERMQLQMRCRQ